MSAAVIGAVEQKGITHANAVLISLAIKGVQHGGNAGTHGTEMHWHMRRIRDELTLIASGGIRSGVDMAKAMVLGAELCGIASPFLEPAMESADAVMRVIEKIRREFVTAMFLLGMGTISELVGNEDLLF